MFRRFMIVCWVLFGIALAVSTASYVGLAIEANSFEAGSAAPGQDIAPDVLADLNEQKKLRFLAKSPFYEPAHWSLGVAGVVLLWNIIWHIGHWIWMGRKQERGTE